MSNTRILAMMLVLVACFGCRPDDQRTDSVDAAAIEQQRESLSPEVRAQLDSGSAAFRRDDHQAALGFYTQATELDEGAAAGWFGIYMAQQALGDDDAAAAALARAQSSVPGATLIHPTKADSIR